MFIIKNEINIVYGLACSGKTTFINEYVKLNLHSKYYHVNDYYKLKTLLEDVTEKDCIIIDDFYPFDIRILTNEIFKKINGVTILVETNVVKNIYNQPTNKTSDYKHNIVKITKKDGLNYPNNIIINDTVSVANYIRMYNIRNILS